LLDFDATRQPVRPHELTSLVRAIEGAHSSDEQDWLEWKSGLDLGSKTHLASIARCILALSNRDPAIASDAVEGYGYMVIGVEPGRAEGVAVRDNADLDRDLQRLLGQDGPRWRPLWVEYANVSILVVEVSPPRPGDPIFVAQRSSEGLSEGAVYVRHRARSQPATAADIRVLSERLQSAGHTLRLSLAPSGDEASLCPVQDASREVAEYVAASAKDLLDFLPKPEMKSTRLGDFKPDLSALLGMDKVSVSSLSSLVNIQEETRTEDEYRAEVAAYASDLARGMQDVLDHIAAQYLVPLCLRLANLTDSNYEGLRVEVHLEGDVRATEPVDMDASFGYLLPTPPRKWGPYERSPIGIRNFGLAGSYMPRQAPGSTLRIENGGSATLTFPTLHLRPRAVEELDAVIVLAPEGMETIHARWTATATNIEGVAGGAFEFSLMGEPFDCWDALVTEWSL